MTEIEPLRCEATVGQEPSDWGFRSVRCGQTVAVRGYWAQTHRWENTGHFAVYCSVPGHRENVERRFPPLAEPEWPGDLPEVEAPDPIDQYKGWTEAEKAYGR